jgi:hypothetical protein
VTRVKPTIHRSGVPAERRKTLEIEECGFLPNAATLFLQKAQIKQSQRLFTSSPLSVAMELFPGVGVR